MNAYDVVKKDTDGSAAQHEKTNCAETNSKQNPDATTASTKDEYRTHDDTNNQETTKRIDVKRSEQRTMEQQNEEEAYILRERTRYREQRKKAKQRMKNRSENAGN